MKTFAISWLRFVDGEIHMAEFEAHSLYEAICEAFFRATDTKYEGIPTAEDVIDAGYDDHETALGAIQIGGI